ncbi:hypothetical protein U472_09655 [Orenia metallireducens]|uniref:CTP synthase (glutamine hydrolyzing) n=1 Tax=Orenia metallireducens TaxID=1413210 RepID=A0A1C0A7P4_9FIRM|nr:hypothetical protein [Orenia metallireducens]OCL26266.1 hypothetical protein U472_09655 [Orenia metallireducens]
MIEIAVIGEYEPDFNPHSSLNKAIKHSANNLGVETSVKWFSTEMFKNKKNLEPIAEYDAVWIAPGSPYKSLVGALNCIQYVRENNIPTFGTCGGFQHLVLEYARNIMGIEESQHAEYDPYSSKLIINKLNCSLAGKKLPITITNKQSKVFSLYNETKIEEKYYCNFGLNPDYQKKIDKAGLKVVGIDDTQEARIIELPNHKFYIGTLFVPQTRSTNEKPHPLITGFIKAAYR